MTLEELIRETAIYLDETLTFQNGDFLEVDVVNKIKKGLNFAYMKICKEGVIRKTKDITNNYELEDNVLEVEKVTVNDIDYQFDIINNKVVYWSDKPATLTYIHVPPEMLSYTDIPEFPSRIIDHNILCFYSAFFCYNIDSNPSAGQWLSMWEDEFKKIKCKRFSNNAIQQVYTM
jgi:hypothetical protein